MIALTLDCEEAVDRSGSRCRCEVSPESPVDQLDRLAEHAAGGVDVLDGQLDAGDLRRAEEGEVAGLRQQGADGQRAVAGSVRRRRPAAGPVVGGRVGLVAGDRNLVFESSILLSSPNCSRPKLATAGSPGSVKSSGPETPS